MSNSSGDHWLDDPSAPRIPHLVRFEEKTFLAGGLLGAIFYGSTHTLFFVLTPCSLNSAFQESLLPSSFNV